MAVPDLTRRSLLGAMAAASAAAAAPTLAGRAQTPWRAARAKYEAARAAHLKYDSDVYGPSEAAHRARLSAVAPTVLEYRDGAGFDRVMRSDDGWSVDSAKRVATIPQARRGEHPERVAVCDRFWALHQERERQLAIIAADPKYMAIIDRSDALGNLACELFDAAVATPVRTLSELCEKIEMIEERGDEEVSFDAIAADVRRLAAH